LQDRDELLQAYALVAQWEPEVVIQNDRRRRRPNPFLPVSRPAGQPRARFPGGNFQWPLDCGNTAISEPLKHAATAEKTVELTETIWQRVGFRGLGSIEYKLHPATNALVIMEPTVGRTNYQNELAVINGCNIPLAAYCDLAGIEQRAFTTRTVPVKLVDGSAERRARWAQWHGYLQPQPGPARPPRSEAVRAPAAG
jgi:hypothetical protein